LLQEQSLQVRIRREKKRELAGKENRVKKAIPTCKRDFGSKCSSVREDSEGSLKSLKETILPNDWYNRSSWGGYRRKNVRQKGKKISLENGGRFSLTTGK